MSGLMTPEEVAAALRVSTQTVRRYGAQNRIERVTLTPRCIRYTRRSVEALLGGSEHPPTNVIATNVVGNCIVCGRECIWRRSDGSVMHPGCQ